MCTSYNSSNKYYLKFIKAESRTIFLDSLGENKLNFPKIYEQWSNCFLEHFDDSVASNAIFGLSAVAVEAYGFTLVRPSVRHTSYLENRASDFDDFLHKATS